jgi:N-acetylmuramoyl-L-alanine amidase
VAADDMTGGSLTRRPVLKFLAGGAVAVTGGGIGLARLSPDDDAGDVPALALSSHAGYGVSSLDIPLDSRRLEALDGGRWQTRQLPTSTHSMVALTWTRSAREPRIRIRSRRRGRWEEWRAMPILHDLPDRSSEEGRADVAGTDLVWIGAADGIQVEVSGDRPPGLTIVLLHPAPVPGRSGLAGQRRGNAKRKAKEAEPTRAPRPELLRRHDWGAEKSWRPGNITYNETIRQVHVHHTVNSNTYSRSDVAGLIRGMYRYHVHNLGWSDIGYNFLVDRFGRTWVGRAGGARRLVRGAHTLGFNSTSTGVAVIGNFETTKPSRKVLAAIAALAAWKLDRYDRNPRGRVRVTSEGSDNFPAGRAVRLPVIDGHRDTNDTACPGRHLYEALPAVRRRARRIVKRYEG